MTGKEKIFKVKEVLEENLGLEWTDRLVYNLTTKTYHTANSNDFWPGVATYAYLRDSKKKAYLARVKVDETNFKIELNGMKIDVSQHWQDLVNDQDDVNTIK